MNIKSNKNFKNKYEFITANDHKHDCSLIEFCNDLIQNNLERTCDDLKLLESALKECCCKFTDVVALLKLFGYKSTYTFMGKNE
jgi:hypothetical protein